MTTIHWGELTSHAGPIVNHYFLMMILMAMMGEIALHYQLLSWSDLRFLLYSNASLSLNSVVVFLQILFRFILGGRGLFLKREGHQFALKKDGMYTDRSAYCYSQQLLSCIIWIMKKTSACWSNLPIGQQLFPKRMCH